VARRRRHEGGLRSGYVVPAHGGPRRRAGLPHDRPSAPRRARAEALPDGAGPTFPGERGRALAEKLPNDEGIAELLHLAVRATRYGCRDADTSKASSAPSTCSTRSTRRARGRGRRASPTDPRTRRPLERAAPRPSSGTSHDGAEGASASGVLLRLTLRVGPRVEAARRSVAHRHQEASAARVATGLRAYPSSAVTSVSRRRAPARRAGRRKGSR